MTSLTLSLANPNTLLPHRAGIAGLALALQDLPKDQAPLTWDITDDGVNLAWEGSDRSVVEWLMEWTYIIEDGYLNIPALKLDSQGRYTLTQGITSTLLQHNRHRSLSPQKISLRFPLEEGQPEIQVSFCPLLTCYYTGDFKDAFNKKGDFKSKIVVKGNHLPGLIECFVNGPATDSPGNFLALLFLPLACFYYKLPGPGLRSAMVIPEVKNLKQWMDLRQELSGRTYRTFHANSASEAGLRFLIQEQTTSEKLTFKVDSCEVYQLGGQPWDRSQTYLKQKIYRIQATDQMLTLYKSAFSLFPSKSMRNEKGEIWFAFSKVLPWITDNLVAHQPWYRGFFEFRKAQDLYERRGLVKMTRHLTAEEKLLFEVVQGAFRAYLRGQGQEAQRQGRSLDYQQAQDKVIYRLQRPNTQQDFASALVGFLSGSRSKAAKGKGMEIYHWLYGADHWKRARDLALLAIATYEGHKETELEPIDPISSFPEQAEGTDEGTEDYQFPLH